MTEITQHPRSRGGVSSRSRLFLLAVLLALLGCLALASTAQATIRAWNTDPNLPTGNQYGVSAIVDPAYLQAAPIGYTPVMEVRMNNNYGPNRSLEWQLRFPNTTGPYRDIMLALYADGVNKGTWALSNPNNPSPHTLTIRCISENEISGEARWTVYCDGQAYIGSTSWYLPTHGTTSETRVYCSNHEAEWAHFSEIETQCSVGGDWYLRTGPVTVVDDNPHFAFYWEQNNYAWHASPSPRADNDQYWEVGTWGQAAPAGISPFLDNGFRDQFAGWVPYNYDTYVYQGVQQGANVHERDLRLIGGGMAATGFDKPDFSLWASHGNYNVLETNTWEDFMLFDQNNARWGETDLEWAYIFACYFGGWVAGDDLSMRRDYQAMAGAHAICGFSTEFGCPNDNQQNPQSGDDYHYGRDLVRFMRGQEDTLHHTVIHAFELTASRYEGYGHTTRCFMTPTTVYDHFVGYGSYAITDPTGWPGGPTYYVDHTCY